MINMNKLVLLTAATVFSFQLAHSQNPPPPKQPGQPPAQGGMQPPPPGNPPPGGPNGTGMQPPPPPGGPNGPGMQPPHGNMPPGQHSTMGMGKDDKKCPNLEKKLRKQGDSCLKKKSAEEAKACMDKVKTQAPQNFEQMCPSIAKPLEAEYMAKLQQKIGSEDMKKMAPPQGHSGNMPPHGDMAKEQGTQKPCDPNIMKKFSDMASKCLDVKDEKGRGKCCSEVGKKAEKEHACQPQLDALHADIIQKEQSKYNTAACQGH